MLAQQLITTTYPVLQMQDTIEFALQLMDDYDVQHLPVYKNNLFVGLVSKVGLEDENEHLEIASIANNFIDNKTFATEHFLKVIGTLTNNNLSLIAVVNEALEHVGCITAKDVISTINKFIGNEEQGAVIVLEIEKRNYAFGEINRLIESNDAYITQLNTEVDASTGNIIATIKINKIELSAIVATLQRYDYNVKYYFGEEEYANEIQDNYNNLLSYLSI
jgi:acetoin utilization protein AcuB